VFQPNRFNRMDKMSAEYRDAFVDADMTLITEIYASGTAPIEGVSGTSVVDAIRSAHPGSDVRWCPTRSMLIDEVVENVREGDVCISMGCGDIEHLPAEVMQRIGVS
jgi:UDP-N-acetylmuramate--alanine ligase